MFTQNLFIYFALPFTPLKSSCEYAVKTNRERSLKCYLDGYPSGPQNYILSWNALRTFYHCASNSNNLHPFFKTLESILYNAKWKDRDRRSYSNFVFFPYGFYFFLPSASSEAPSPSKASSASSVTTEATFLFSSA
jgi:hypothetical protein